MISANNLAYANDVSKTIPEQVSTLAGEPTVDAAAARTQQPRAAAVPSWWTEERIEELKEHWGTGDSATVIAAAMHTTRNAILGKVHRLGLISRAVIRVTKPPRLRSVVKSREIKPRLGVPRRQVRPALVPIISVITGTFATTRKSRPPIAEMTKTQLRAMLTQALHNTAKLAIVP